MANTHPGQNPWLDPAYGVEMSERERKELMTVDDWGEVIDRFLEQPTQEDCPVCEGPMTEPAGPEGWCAECEAIAEAR